MWTVSDIYYIYYIDYGYRQGQQEHGYDAAMLHALLLLLISGGLLLGLGTL